MTLLFIDGFDHYTSNASVAAKWTAVSSTYPVGAATSGRRGGGALQLITNFATAQKTLPSTYSTIIVGFARKTFNGTVEFLEIKEGSTIHLSFTYDTGKIKAWRGDKNGTLLGTSATTIDSTSWWYIEVKATISDSTGGSLEVRINGSADANLTLSGIDTRNGGASGVVSNIYLSCEGYVDDLYVCDTAGSTNNDFLGDCRIDTIYPAGAGNYTQFTPSAGSNYACVDETAPNTTDYVSDATSGDIDSYACGDISALLSSSVYGAQVNAYAKKSDSGSRSLGTMARLSSTDSIGTSTALGTSYGYISQIYETDPSSAAWTRTNVNSAEFGVKVTA